MYQYPTYQPPVQVVPATPGSYCVFVYNLPITGDDNLLYRLFGPFGAISQVSIGRDPQGTAKVHLFDVHACIYGFQGYGFVHYLKYEDAQQVLVWVYLLQTYFTQAIATMNGALLENKLLQVSFKAPKKK